MGRGVSVTKEEYDFIKLLIKQSKSTEEICKMVKRSPDTVRCVEYSADYADFKMTPTKELRKRMKKNESYQICVNDVCAQEDVASQCDEKTEESEKTEDHPVGNAKREEHLHHKAVIHTALVMGRIQTSCDSWHLENGKVTMIMDYDTWYDVCLHYGISEEVAEWASRSRSLARAAAARLSPSRT